MGDIARADGIGALAAFELVLRKHGYDAPASAAGAAGDAPDAAAHPGLRQTL